MTESHTQLGFVSPRFHYQRRDQAVSCEEEDLVPAPVCTPVQLLELETKVHTQVRSKGEGLYYSLFLVS